MRKIIIVAVALLVGALHFVVGPQYKGPWPDFVHGYLIDILLPFAMVLMMGLMQTPVLRNPVVRVLSVFGVGALVETLQYFGIGILGRTFDPLDYVMYALGAALGALLDTVVLSRLPNGTKRGQS
jgi:hypothetical protein